MHFPERLGSAIAGPFLFTPFIQLLLRRNYYIWRYYYEILQLRKGIHGTESYRG